MVYVDYFDDLLLMVIIEMLYFVYVSANDQFENDDLFHQFVIDIDHLINLILLNVVMKNLIYYF